MLHYHCTIKIEDFTISPKSIIEGEKNFRLIKNLSISIMKYILRSPKFFDTRKKCTQEVSKAWSECT